MPVTLINGFVLLPNAIDWSMKPSWQRSWETGLSTALTGAERRQSLRNLAREQLSYAISTATLEERAMLDERLDAASKSGFACCPFWGRGSTLAADVTDIDVALPDSLWPFVAGDWVFFMDAFRNYDVRQIAEVQHPAPTADSDTVTVDSTHYTADEEGAPMLILSDAVSRTYPAGSLMWPMFFGKFSMEKQTAVTSWHSDVKVTLAELAARRLATIGKVPAPGAGIGSMAIGSTFIIA